MDTVITPIEMKNPSKREQVLIWVRQSDIVDAAADLFHTLSSRVTTPRNETVHLSGDDEHMWIGLAP